MNTSAFSATESRWEFAQKHFSEMSKRLPEGHRIREVALFTSSASTRSINAEKVRGGLRLSEDPVSAFQGLEKAPGGTTPFYEALDGLLDRVEDVLRLDRSRRVVLWLYIDGDSSGKYKSPGSRTAWDPNVARQKFLERFADYHVTMFVTWIRKDNQFALTREATIADLAAGDLNVGGKRVKVPIAVKSRSDRIYYSSIRFPWSIGIDLEHTLPHPKTWENESYSLKLAVSNLPKGALEPFSLSNSRFPVKSGILSIAQPSFAAGTATVELSAKNVEGLGDAGFAINIPVDFAEFSDGPDQLYQVFAGGDTLRLNFLKNIPKPEPRIRQPAESAYEVGIVAYAEVADIAPDSTVRWTYLVDGTEIELGSDAMKRKFRLPRLLPGSHRLKVAVENTAGRTGVADKSFQVVDVGLTWETTPRIDYLPGGKLSASVALAGSTSSDALSWELNGANIQSGGDSLELDVPPPGSYRLRVLHQSGQFQPSLEHVFIVHAIPELNFVQEPFYEGQEEPLRVSVNLSDSPAVPLLEEKGARVIAPAGFTPASVDLSQLDSVSFSGRLSEGGRPPTFTLTSGDAELASKAFMPVISNVLFQGHVEVPGAQSIFFGEPFKLRVRDANVLGAESVQFLLHKGGQSTVIDTFAWQQTAYHGNDGEPLRITTAEREQDAIPLGQQGSRVEVEAVFLGSDGNVIYRSPRTALDVAERPRFFEKGEAKDSFYPDENGRFAILEESSVAERIKVQWIAEHLSENQEPVILKQEVKSVGEWIIPFSDLVQADTLAEEGLPLRVSAVVSPPPGASFEPQAFTWTFRVAPKPPVWRLVLGLLFLFVGLLTFARMVLGNRLLGAPVSCFPGREDAGIGMIQVLPDWDRGQKKYLMPARFGGALRKTGWSLFFKNGSLPLDGYAPADCIEKMGLRGGRVKIQSEKNPHGMRLDIADSAATTYGTDSARNVDGRRVWRFRRNGETVFFELTEWQRFKLGALIKATLVLLVFAIPATYFIQTYL